MPTQKTYTAVEVVQIIADLEGREPGMFDYEHCPECPAAKVQAGYRYQIRRLKQVLKRVSKACARLVDQQQLTKLRAEVDKQRRQLEEWNRYRPFFEAALHVRAGLDWDRSVAPDSMTEAERGILGALESGLEACEIETSELPEGEQP